MKTNHVFLVPAVVFSLSPSVVSQQQVVVVASLAFLGFGGMMARSQTAASLTSASLLGLIIWGKVASDLYHLASLDSGLLLLEFMLVILLMEASNTAVSFDRVYSQLSNKNDDISTEYRERLIEWAGDQLLGIGRLIALGFGLSLGLLVVGDLVSVNFDQIAFSGILVLVAVVSLLILLTHGREPEEQETRKT